MFKGSKIYLRILDKSDATKLLIWENDSNNWKVSDTDVPFSMDQILEYVNHSQAFRQTGQVRFMICENESQEPIGTIDLYDINFKHSHATIGVLISDKSFENKGFASEAVKLIVEYAKDFLGLFNLQATMHCSNPASEAIFLKNDFELIGERTNWLKFKNERFNEKIYQLCLKD